MVRVTIIGMGLIGTSLGMALRSADDKESGLHGCVITGYDAQSRATTDARGRLAIDREARTLEEALHEAQLIILAVPAQALHDLFVEIAPLVPYGSVVTDVASTKAQVLEWARELLPRTVDFVGGHPMAGKERSGAKAADPALFKGAIYCLTPLAQTRQSAIELVDEMVRQVGAKTYYIDPTEHDHYVAGVSHLPFLLSTVLIEATSRSPAWREMTPLAATGFRDISRLASGDVEMHRDICLTNSTAMIRWIDDTIRILFETRDALESSNSDALEALFRHAREMREEWLNSRPNLRPGEEEFEQIASPTMPERSGLFGWRLPRDRRR